MSLPSALTSLSPNELNPRIDRLRGQLDTLAKGSGDKEQLQKAAQELEALFVSYLLKVMRSTVEPADEESTSLGKETYLEMFDQEIALNIARTRAFGISDLVLQQLQEIEEQDAKTRDAGQSPSRTPQRDVSLRQPSSVNAPSAQSRSFHPETLPDHAERPDAKISSSLEMPAKGFVSSTFGNRTHPMTHRTSFHRGIDIAAPTGTPIRVVQDGIVIHSGLLGTYGNTIIVEHANGYRTLYAHASKNLAGEGDIVKAQQVIGLVGNSGRSTGSHLHFELQKGGEQVDPSEYLAVAKSPVKF